MWFFISMVLLVCSFCNGQNDKQIVDVNLAKSAIGAYCTEKVEDVCSDADDEQMCEAYKSIKTWTFNNEFPVQMCESCNSFNVDISGWTIEQNGDQAVDMGFAFKNCKKFNQNVNWNIKVSLTKTFENAEEFNQNINNWKTDSVMSFSSAFENAYKFNQPLHNWNVQKAFSLNYAFKKASAFNQNLDSWDTSSVQTMDQIFNGAKSYDKSMKSWKFDGIVKPLGDKTKNWCLNCSLSICTWE